mgnify:CR=1 FL=1
MNRPMILVIDGQGGRLGALIVERLRAAPCPAEVLAGGTNSAASATRLRAGADAAATGEFPVILNAPRAAVIVAPLGAAVAGSMHGEITPAMAEAVGLSAAEKVLIPSVKCTLHVVGAETHTMPEYAALAAEAALAALEG